jgi:hypothetical protein
VIRHKNVRMQAQVARRVSSSVNPVIDDRLRTEPDGLVSRFAAVSHSCLSEDLKRARAHESRPPCLIRVSPSLRRFVEVLANLLISSWLRDVKTEPSNVAEKAGRRVLIQEAPSRCL